MSASNDSRPNSADPETAEGDDMEESLKAALADPKLRALLDEEQITELQGVFQMFDVDGSGAIDITEFERIAIDLGEPLSHEELQEIVKDLDKDGSGVVSYDEFIRWWRKTT